MLRSTAIRPLTSAIAICPRAHTQLNPHSIRHFTQSIACTARPVLPQQSRRPLSIQKTWPKTASIRLLYIKATGAEFKKEQEQNRKETIKPNPEGVSTTSTVRAVFEPAPKSKVQNVSEDPDMLRGIRSDLRTIKETFALEEVPREVFWIGMGGITPYVITSFSTLYLAWDINYATEHGMGYLVSKETADSLLHILEPTQIALGAIILSFLGAVHWGLEMAQYGGRYPYHRYLIGVVAPALAWPTVFLPLDYALLAQFVGFVGMYFADSQATTWGWAPRWYMTYRFILTFVVGACMIMTLIGRGQIGDAVTPTEGARKHLQDIRLRQREHVVQEEELVHHFAAEDKKAREERDQQGQSTDPREHASDDQPGKQGIYSDEFQGTRGTSTPGGPTEPTREKKGVQQPVPERKASTATRG
ncbi:hypothetical protein BDD12DRAFT_825644 [Trichophaea hybrida]|nr:hypothetical protein BDD12DRAFT_825644 [Trichophaea hybrida]